MNTKGYYWNILDIAMNIPELHGTHYDHKLRVLVHKANNGSLKDIEVQALRFCLKELSVQCKLLVDSIKAD